jgi:hypothetical protein
MSGQSGTAGDVAGVAGTLAKAALGAAILGLGLVLLDAPPAEAVALVAFAGLVGLGAAFGLGAAAVVVYVRMAPEGEAALAAFSAAGEAAGAAIEARRGPGLDGPRDEDPEQTPVGADGGTTHGGSEGLSATSSVSAETAEPADPAESEGPVEDDDPAVGRETVEEVDAAEGSDGADVSGDAESDDTDDTGAFVFE